MPWVRQRSRLFSLAKLRYIWRWYTRYSVFVCTFGLLMASSLVAKLSGLGCGARRLCRLDEAPTPCHGVVDEPPETPFTTKKEIRGKSQKIRQRVFGCVGTLGARYARRRQGGASLILLKIGSNLVVKLHQIWTNPQNHSSPSKNGRFAPRFAILSWFGAD